MAAPLTKTLGGKHEAQSEMEFTKVEREVIGLWVACGSLDSMVNHALLKLVGDGGVKEVHFETSTHQQLFNILLLDFLEKVDVKLTGEQGSCLEVNRHRRAAQQCSLGNSRLPESWVSRGQSPRCLRPNQGLL